MPPGGTIDLSLQTKAVPQRRASDIGGTYINWIDGDTLSWTLGRVALSRGDGGAVRERHKPDDSTRQSRREPQHDASRPTSRAASWHSPAHAS